MTKKTINNLGKKREIGKGFENNEGSFWEHEKEFYSQVYILLECDGKMGKWGIMDFYIPYREDKFAVVGEIKASRWDLMKPHRVRPNVLSHSRQIWKYLEAILEPVKCKDHNNCEKIRNSKKNVAIQIDIDKIDNVIPAIVYPRTPITEGRKEEIEDLLQANGIQVVWRDEETGYLKDYFRTSEG